MLKSDIPILRADQIAQAIDRVEEFFPVPEWATPEMAEAGQVPHIKLKAWSLEQRDMVMSLATDNGRVDGKIDPAKLVHLLVLYGVSDPALTESIIKEKSPTVIDGIATAVMRLNGMAKEAALTASMTFRPESGPGVSVPAGEGSGENGQPAAT